MTRPLPDSLAPIKGIFLPTDFSHGAHTAFLHALKLALVTKSKLAMLHVLDADEEWDWADFPHVRETLEKWGVLAAGSDREDLAKLGFDVRKSFAKDKSPLEACLESIDHRNPDLIVLSTHQQGGGTHWLGGGHNPLAEPLARAAGEMTLFIPSESEGFVQAETGTLTLRRILVPVDTRPRPQRAVDAAALIARLAETAPVDATVLHVGTAGSAPSLDLHGLPGCSWQERTAQGDVVKSILAEADRMQADLIVMTTEGHHGFLDALRGSTTERVMREARCPLLAIPAGGW